MFKSRVLPFGAAASVRHFLRVSAFLHAAGMFMGLCWAAYFDDFILITHECHRRSSFQSALSLFKLFGFPVSTDKLADFDTTAEVLGVELDVKDAHAGTIRVKNKQSRIDELVQFLDTVLTRGYLKPSEMPSKLGKLQFAEAQIWGRGGRLALADLRELSASSRNNVSLDNRTVRAVGIFKDKLSCGDPRTLNVSQKTKLFLIFTDGSLEYNDKLPPGRIGAVCIRPDGATMVFGADVPSDVLEKFKSDGKEHVIGLIELYAVACAFSTWADCLKGQRVILFIDSWPVCDTAIRGNSREATWRDLLMELELIDEYTRALMWICRAPSKSNPADGPSRATLSEINFLAPLKICLAFCPMVRRELRSILS